MNNQLYSDITETIYTKTQADDFILQLDNFTDSIFDIREDLNTKLSRYLPFDKKEKILSTCQQNNIKLDDLNSLQNFLTDLKNYIKNLSTIDLQVAIELNNVKIISSWFSFKLKQKVLVNTTVNTKLIGGAIVGFKGVYKDFTLKKRLDEKL